MKKLFRNNFIEVSLVKAIVLGVAKADDEYALMIGCIVIEFKTYNMFRQVKKTPNTL